MWWCLHGALGSFRDWRSLSLPPHQAVDLWSTPAFETMEEWASHFCRHVASKDDSPSLLGYSMGGRLALHALLAAPELWRQAVIIAAHPGLHNPTARQQRRAHDQAWLRRFLNEPMTQVMPDWNAQAVFAGTSKTSFPEAFTPAMGRAFQEWSLGNQPPLWDQLPSLTTPVRWLCGERDSKFVALGNEAVALLPRGQFSQAPKCHHRVPWEWNGFGEWLVDREPQG